jgi:hypothetical protein
MGRLFAIAILTAAALPAADFSIGIGNSVAGRSFQAKGAVMVARPENCADPAKARFEGTAEGLVNGARKTVHLKLAALDTPGVVAIFHEWPNEGAWVVNLRGTCEAAHAGAVVPMGPKGFVRESAKFYSRAASDAEVEAALKSFAASQSNQ